MTDKSFHINLDAISKRLNGDNAYRPALESFEELRRQHRQATMFDIPELQRQVEAAKRMNDEQVSMIDDLKSKNAAWTAEYQSLRERLDREETRADGNFDAYEKAKAENVELMKLLTEDSNWKSAFEQEYKVSGERGREIFRLKAEIQELRLSRLIDGLEILKHTDKATYDLAVAKIKPVVDSWVSQLKFVVADS